VSGPLGAWFKRGRSMGPSALIGVMVLLAIELGLNGGSLTSRVAAPDPSFRARLERGPCLGSCPNYVVDVAASGAVTFVGHPPGRNGFGVCLGRRTWRVPAASVAALEANVDRSGFFGLQRDYRGVLSDAAQVNLTITRLGHTKTVSDYLGLSVGMPRAMAVLEDAVDQASDDRRCIGDRAHPLSDQHS
jgi:hypothetical protein